MYEDAHMYGVCRADDCSPQGVACSQRRTSGITLTETYKPYLAKTYSMAHPNLPGQPNRIGEKVERCPYCVEAGEFKAMTGADSGEGHICARCGHLTRSSNPRFECNCTRCVGLRFF
jgi:hypothetical protein